MCQLPNPSFPAADDAVPFGKFSNGPPTVPYVGYDASFYEIDRIVDEEGRQRSEQGTQTEIVLAMPPGKFIKGIYTWAWRKHPPLTQFTVVIPEGDLMPDGATLTIDAFVNGQASSVEDISDQAPEKIIYKALKAFDAKVKRNKVSKKALAIIDNVKDQIGVMKNKLTLPPGFEKDTAADFTAVYMNGETYVESQEKGGPQNNWILQQQQEGDVVNGTTIINADNIKSFFRTVMFSKGQVQYGTPVDSRHNEFGNFNYKPVYGLPLFVAGGWKSEFVVVSQDGLYSEEDEVGDLQHEFTNFSGFSGPVVPGMFEGPMGSGGLFDFGFGVPIAPGDTLNAEIEMPRNLGGNRSVLYLFDPMRHDNSVFSLHTP